jgi:hypothetical protein
MCALGACTHGPKTPPSYRDEPDAERVSEPAIGDDDPEQEADAADAADAADERAGEVDASPARVDAGRSDGSSALDAGRTMELSTPWLGSACGGGCQGTYCSTSGSLCAASDLKMNCLGTGTGLYCSRTCTSDAQCANGARAMKCLTDCASEPDAQGLCWAASDYDFFMQRVCRGQDAGAEVGATEPQPAPFCANTQPTFAFLDGFESYPAGSISGASARWQRVTTSNFGANITDQWAHGCSQNLSIQSSYASSEVDLAQLAFPSRPSRLNIELWLAVDAFSNTGFATFGLGKRSGPNIQPAVSLRAQGQELRLITPWRDQVVTTQLQTGSFGQAAVHNYVRVELDFCAGEAKVFVGATPSSATSTTVMFGGTRDFDAFYISGGIAATYIDDLAIWTPDTPLDRDQLCPFKVLSHIMSPGSSCTGLAWDGSTLWMADNLERLHQLDTTGTALRTIQARSDVHLAGLAWDGSGFWTSNYTRPAKVGLDGTLVARHTISLWSDSDRVAWDGHDFWWLTTNLDAVTKYDANGTQLLRWTPRSYSASGITFAAANVWLVEYELFPVLMAYTPQGTRMRSVRLDKLGITTGNASPQEPAWDGEAMWLCRGFDIYRIQLDAGAHDAQRACALGSLPCASGGPCVPSTKFCDGPSDCASGLDESACRGAPPSP